MQKIDIVLGYIHMSSYTAKTRIKDASVQILPANRLYILEIDYPLQRPFQWCIETSKRGMTRRQLINLIIKQYKRIYKQEEKDVGGKTGNIPGMLNRAPSKGRWGIWGHNLSDLILATAHINGALITLGVDS